MIQPDNKRFEVVPTFQATAPLALDELRGMVGQWVWVVVEYERGSQAEGWAIVSTPAVVCFLEQWLPTNSVGKTFTAYRHKPKERE